MMTKIRSQTRIKLAREIAIRVSISRNSDLGKKRTGVQRPVRNILNIADFGDNFSNEGIECR